jgi:hypothetical protein
MSIHTRKLPLLLLLAVVAFLPIMAFSGAANAQGGNKLSLPITVKTGSIGRATNIMGGELTTTDVMESAYKAAQGGVTWSRYTPYNWYKVERYEYERNWEGEAQAEERLAEMSAAGLTPIMVIHGTAEWAQAIPGKFCGPIAPEHYDAFGEFMYTVVERFSKAPYNVQYYEIYNEPDIDPADARDPYSAFGCWGDKTDTQYYGGDDFGRMMSVVYPRIKAANPNAQVLIGGLLLRCDYTHTYDTTQDCQASHFLEGVLETGGNSFDIISYHGYPTRSTVREEWDRNFYLWKHRGGVVLGKLDFIKQMFREANIPMKPVLLTEAGLLCYKEGMCNHQQEGMQQDQANYAMRLYPRAQANGIMGALWYTFSGPGWRDSGILDANQNPRPAYRTFQFLSRVLPNATSTGIRIEENGDLEIYSFSKGTTNYTFYFANGTTNYTRALPLGARVFNKFGEEIPAPTNGILTVTFEPVMVQVGQ